MDREVRSRETLDAQACAQFLRARFERPNIGMAPLWPADTALIYCRRNCVISGIDGRSASRGGQLSPLAEAVQLALLQVEALYRHREPTRRMKPDFK